MPAIAGIFAVNSLAQSNVPVTLSRSSGGQAVSITRTADVNAYTANDVIGAATGSTAIQTFAIGPPAGGNVMITSASIEVDDTGVIAGETSYRLHLYDSIPASALGDNAAWDLPSGDRVSYLGYIDIGTIVDLGSTLYVEANAINKQVELIGNSIYGYLVTIGAYTPTSARVYVVTLNAVWL